MRVLATASIVALLTQPSLAQTRDDAVRDYVLCVRRNAEILEPSDDSPQDVARAAILLCSREESLAFNVYVGEAGSLRDTAIFYGAGQATIARACRKAGRCGLAPIGASSTR